MALCKFSITRVVVVLAFVYLTYNLYSVYSIFYPSSCAPNQKENCIRPAHTKDTKLQLWIYISTIKSNFPSKAKLLYHNSSFYRNDGITKTLNVSIPQSTQRNGTLYAHVFLGPKKHSPMIRGDRSYLSVSVVTLTKYAVPASSTFNLLSNMNQDNASSSDRPVTHWVPWLHVYSLEEDWHFDRFNVPPDILNILRVFHGTSLLYLPILYVDRLKITNKQLKPLTSNITLDLIYAPVSIGKLRLWLIFAQALTSMKALGFTEKEFDDLKGIFLDSNFWLFGMTVLISVFHMLFDFLAFKNDISFWRKHKTMVGLSSRTIVWRCFSQLVVFLYLMDQQTSLLVLIPTGISSIIEFWKVTKALKISFVWTRFLPWMKLGAKGEDEKLSESFDSEAMSKLSYLLYPLLLAGAVYQLLYNSYTSWYSWLIQSLVNGVYAFGFLFMLPQLFLNYKLKSVAHLPWRPFMYKAFNTFIDDVFAFIITMPTAHRIAVFRDDVVFLIYLYQRWLYPVDKTRTNEFGQTFDSENAKSVKEKSD